MPPRASAMAPTPETAAMSAPVNGRPEATVAGAEMAPVTTMVVLAESPVAPLARIVWVPGVVSEGIVTVTENVPEALALVVARVTGVLCSVREIVSLGTKLLPVTVMEPPGVVEEVLVATDGPLPAG